MEHDKDDLFIFKLNDNFLHFGKRKLCVVSGLIFGKKFEFHSDIKNSNKLMSKYYPGIKKVRDMIFITESMNFFRKKDLYKINMVNFIIRFLKPDLSRIFFIKVIF